MSLGAGRSCLHLPVGLVVLLLFATGALQQPPEDAWAAAGWAPTAEVQSSSDAGGQPPAPTQGDWGGPSGNQQLASWEAASELATYVALDSVGTPTQYEGEIQSGLEPATIALKPLSYTVEPGDSLMAIAEHFGIDLPTLLGSNEIDDPALLQVGSQITILPVTGVLYRIAEGDTLNRIAESYGVAVRDILLANGIENSEMVTHGQELVLPGARPLRRTDPVPAVASADAEPASQQAFLWPATGRITSYFGRVSRVSPRGHAGLDIAASWGEPVVAAQAGDVVLATRNGGAYGIQVIIEHEDGVRTLYAHLSSLEVETGERVASGQLIGHIGSTGFSTGPHLHFEIHDNGGLRDPLHYLR